MLLLVLYVCVCACVQVNIHLEAQGSQHTSFAIFRILFSFVNQGSLDPNTFRTPTILLYTICEVLGSISGQEGYNPSPHMRRKQNTCNQIATM